MKHNQRKKVDMQKTKTKNTFLIPTKEESMKSGG